MAARSVNLPEHLAAFVDRQVATGRYRNESEVIGEALRRYEDEVALASALQTIADAGRAAIAAGDCVAVGSAEEGRTLAERLLAEASPAQR